MTKLVTFTHGGLTIFNPYLGINTAADPVIDYGFVPHNAKLVKRISDDRIIVLETADNPDEATITLCTEEHTIVGPYRLKQVAHLINFPEYGEPLPDAHGFVLSSDLSNACPLLVWDDPDQRATCVLPTPKVELWCDYAHPFLREQEGSRYVIRICDIESHNSAVFAEAETLQELAKQLRTWTHDNLGFFPEDAWKSSCVDDIGTLIQLTTCYQFRFLGGLPA